MPNVGHKPQNYSSIVSFIRPKISTGPPSFSSMAARPDDYLLAHTLAMIAVAKGDEGSLWIGTATLDRYLQSVGKPQITEPNSRRAKTRRRSHSTETSSAIPCGANWACRPGHTAGTAKAISEQYRPAAGSPDKIGAFAKLKSWFWHVPAI